MNFLMRNSANISGLHRSAGLNLLAEKLAKVDKRFCFETLFDIQTHAQFSNHY
jgi:hypothetical protein